MQKSTLFLDYIFVTRIGSGRQYYWASSVSSGYIFVTRELEAEIIEAGLQMSYNLCNLPKQITTMNGKTVKYTYFADGTKFKAVDATGKSIIKPETRASIYYNSYGKTSYVELEEDIPPFIYK